MPLIRKDRVAETTATTGTGPLALNGAITGYRAFDDVMAIGDTCYYAVEAVDAFGVPTGAWETGLATKSAASTLTRTVVHASSNAGAAVAFAAGTKRVMLTMTASAIDALGGSAGAGWQLQWTPLQNEPPAANYATLDSRNGRAVLDFDTATQEAAVFSGTLPTDYAGGGVTVHLWCALSTATTGTIGWDVALERTDTSSLDIDADSFATAVTVAAVTVPGISGQVLKMSANIADGAAMDGLVAGELFRLRVRRDVATDTAAGDAELLRVTMVEQ